MAHHSSSSERESESGSENEDEELENESGEKIDTKGENVGQEASSSGEHQELKTIPGDEGSDGEMASAVASASHQANKFLQDSDSEDNEKGIEEEAASGGPSNETGLQSIFGEDSDQEEDSLNRGKRGLSSEGSDGEESEHEAPAKRRKVDSDPEEEGEDGEDAEAVPEGGTGGVESEGEEGGIKEAPIITKEGSVSDAESEEEEEGDSGSEEAPDNEREAEVELQEEVAELVQEGGEVVLGGEEEDEEQGSEDEVEDEKRLTDGPTDWDMMMERRKEAMARARKKRRRDGDLTVNDDHIMALIQQMRVAAEEDRELNLARKAATKKIQLLPVLIAHLKKADLQTTLIECGILSALAEWLSPLPDHSLPHLKIRESILDILKTYPIPDSSILKSSKIGKAIMLLYRHPKEAKKNREKAGKIINEWARPIFGLASDFKSMTRDEREERDYANLSQEARRRISSGERRPSQDDETEQPQKPGDKGWIGRARVPMPSTKGYIVRPKWNMEQEFMKKGSSKKTLNRYEKHLRKKKQEKAQKGSTHAVPISVEGRRMPL